MNDDQQEQHIKPELKVTGITIRTDAYCPDMETPSILMLGRLDFIPSDELATITARFNSSARWTLSIDSNDGCELGVESPRRHLGPPITDKEFKALVAKDLIEYVQNSKLFSNHQRAYITEHLNTFK